MYLKTEALPNEPEIKCALYASVFGPLGFFLAAFVGNTIAGVTSHSRPFAQEAFAFLYIWAIGIIPSMAITSAVGLPVYSVLKYFGVNNPIIVAISGAPVMWLITLLFPSSGYHALFICAAAVVSSIFGILLWTNRNPNASKNT